MMKHTLAIQMMKHTLAIKMMKHTLTITNDETATGGACAVILVEKVGKHEGSSVF